MLTPFLHQEDEYTAALSHIIKRDFFPSLDRLSATNNYLAALESEDTIAIADSIRHLSALTPGPGQRDAQLTAARHRREREMADVAGTPYISRTPFGGAGMETPMPYGPAGELDEERHVKRRRIDLSNGLDVGLAPVRCRLRTDSLLQHRPFKRATPRRTIHPLWTFYKKRTESSGKNTPGRMRQRKKQNRTDSGSSSLVGSS